jgi:hypothetical protein
MMANGVLSDEQIARIKARLEVERAERWALLAANMKADADTIAAEMLACLAPTNVSIIGETMAAALQGWADRLTRALPVSARPDVTALDTIASRAVERMHPRPNFPFNIVRAALDEAMALASVSRSCSAAASLARRSRHSC